jgi:hypothetical protein
MSNGRRSSAVDLVRPVIACLVAVSAIERGGVESFPDRAEIAIRLRSVIVQRNIPSTRCASPTEALYRSHHGKGLRAR